MQTRFLVVIPAYNAARYLEETVRSIQAQTLDDWRLVIVDDGSHDDTLSIAERLASEDCRIVAAHQENRGLTPTRNAGWRMAVEQGISAQYLYFIDSDDIAEPQVLEFAAKYMDRCHEVACLYGDPLWWYSDNASLSYVRRIPRYKLYLGGKVRELPDDEPNTPAATLIGWPAVIPSMCFFRARVFEQVGGWDENLRDGGEDIDLAMHVSMYAEVHYVPMTMIKYRKHSASMNMDQARYFRGLRQMRDKWEAYAASRKPNARYVGNALNDAALIVAYNNAGLLRLALRRGDIRAAVMAAARIVKNGARYAFKRF